MKLANKLISLLLILATLFGLTEPFILTAQAQAELNPSTGGTVPAGAVPTLGTTETGETPESLQRMGEWVYWVEDGLAFVSGYENISETSLVIPAKLGGYPVAGIGKLAFVKNTNLSNIQIHTNVTRIAGDAFLGLNSLTIAAYHGSYALLYAGRYGYPSKNLSTECVFAKNVLDLSGIPSSSYFDLSDNSVKFRTKEATFLAEGQIISFPAYAGHPTGSIGRVSVITDNGDFLAVSLIEPQWGECFERVSGHDKLIMDWDHVIYHNSEDMKIEEVESSANYVKSRVITLYLKNGRTAEFGLDFKICDPVVEWDISGTIPELKTVDVKIPIEATPKLTYGDKAKLVDPGKNAKAQLIKQTIFDIPVISIGGVINGYVSVGVVVELKCDIVVSVTCNCTLHFSKNNGKTKATVENFHYNNAKLETSGELKAGPEISLDLEVGWKGFNIKFLEASIGLYLKITGNAKVQTIMKGVEPFIVDMDADMFIEVGYSVKIGIVSWQFLNKSRESQERPVKLYVELSNNKNFHISHGHWENMARVDQCSLKNRKVFYQIQGNIVQELTANVNEHLSPPNPIRPRINGYKFEGWYVDTVRSRLKGPDYLFDFANDVMPYTYISGVSSTGGSGGGSWGPDAVIIYAKLSKILHPVTGITLDRTSVTDYTSNKAGVQLSAAVIPQNADDPSVSWTSSNTNVCRVSDTGRVTYAGPGTCTVTVRSDSSQNVSASCNFVVKQYVESIAVTGSVASIVAGDTERLSAAVLPNNATDKSLTWSSSNQSVALVDQNGNVTGISDGMVTITAMANDGSGVSGSYRMQVIEEPAVPPTVPVTSITLTNSSPVLYTKNGYTQPFGYTVLPEDADDKTVIWTSSNPDIVTIDGAGMASLHGPGTAIVTGRSRTNPRVSATCTVRVVQNVESISITANKTSVLEGETAQLAASVSPANASDRSVTWTVDDPQIGTVSSTGVFTGISRGRINVTAAANDGSGKSDTIRLTVGENVPIPVDSVVLDQTEITVYTNNKSGIQLHPTVLPADADDTSVYWESNNDQVATVDENGLVHVLKAGMAVISCRSVSDPGVMGTCTFTVKQYADQLFIEGTKDRLLPGETTQLTTDFLPEDTTDKRVAWESSDETIITVDNTGIVTAVAPGTAVIRAAAMDGSDVTSEYPIMVEKNLQLQVTVFNDTVYLQGSNSVALASVELTRASELRMAAAGNDLVWSMTQKTGSSDAEIMVIDRKLDNNGREYDSSLVLLTGSSFTTVGTNVYTITCSAGEYEESVDITITVDGTNYAESLKLTDKELGYNTLTADINEPILIPVSPWSADGKPVPSGLRMDRSGDIYYDAHAHEEITDEGLLVSFDESGIYTATFYYIISNLSYTVEGTFNIADENGIVRIRVADVEISDSFISLVEGDSYNLTASVSPEEAFDKSLTWESSDSSVAAVSEDGVVYAIAPGTAVIKAAANDGSGFIGMCTVSVESYLQLDEKEVEFTVYTGGDHHADLEIVNVTIDSAKRLINDGLNVTWSLEQISGTSAEIGLREYTSEYEEGLTVDGNVIKLLRINSAGTSIYRLICKAENYTASCLITINCIDMALPETITLVQNTFSGTVGEWIDVNTTYMVEPAGSVLPDDVVMSIDGGNAFWNAVSGLYSYAEPERLIFERAGTFSANVVYAGTNYRYVCPITITVAEEDGTVPPTIEEINLDEVELYLTTGDIRTLTASFVPEDAPHSQITWSSTNSAVASVSPSGTVTAIGPGYAVIVASVPETDETGGCLVYVEEGINFRNDSIERSVYVDGMTRMVLDTVMLTDNTNSRMNEAPTWSLRRVSGISLTLRAVPYETVDINGNTLYGCRLLLYSVSKPGDTEYELTCTSGQESKTIPVTIHAVNRDWHIPASISMNQTVFNAGVNELVAVKPELTAFPAGIVLPNGMRVSCEGGKQFLEALNEEDNYVSQSLSTFSFSRAGTYDAEFVFWYSNVQYRSPVVFRIHDQNGFVPVQASRLDLNHRNLYMTAGQSEKLEAVFTPAGVTDKRVTWQTSDPAVATVSENGVVNAVGNGSATISCVPYDTELKPVTCSVTVEDEMTVEPGVTSRTVYIQGKQENNIAAVMLSEGTIERLLAAGIMPEWTVNTDTVTHAVLSHTTADGNIGVLVDTKQLISRGTDTYTVSCKAGSLTWSQQYRLEVIDLAGSIPESITIASPEVSVNVNQPVTIDFTPIFWPDGTAMPADMTDTGFVGVGDFYNALAQYTENGNNVTVSFTKPGKYLLVKRFLLSNLEYIACCTISVGDQSQSRNMLAATETQYTVYSGGKSGNISNVYLTDSIIYQLWGSSVRWNAERISGDSLTIGLKEHGDNADVFVVNVLKKGTDVWRISCTFGDFTEHVDITVTADDPRMPLPERIAVAKDQYTGMIGNWLNIPLGVSCSPEGSMLPDRGDPFWSFSFDQAGEERSEHVIENGALKVKFNVSGYYMGTLNYRSGNVSYSLPLYFIIQDEEQEIRDPNLELFPVNVFDTVYPEGETEIAIGQIVAAEGLGAYSTGAAAAYMKNNPGNWSLQLRGVAASLVLEKVSENVQNLVLQSISRPGDVSYTVNCQLPDGRVLTVDHTLHIADQTEARPDATLLHTDYQVNKGEKTSINKQLYSRADGSILQSSAGWDPAPMLSAVGYEISESNEKWTMTFYETGVYETTVNAQLSNLLLEIPLTIHVAQNGQEFTPTVFLFPRNLTKIGEYAFEGIAANVLDLRGTQIREIEDYAFKNCLSITSVYLPDSISQIAENAFYGCLNAVIYCNDGTYASNWASGHGFSVMKP